MCCLEELITIIRIKIRLRGRRRKYNKEGKEKNMYNM
jgi:hypothetical protein